MKQSERALQWFFHTKEHSTLQDIVNTIEFRDMWLGSNISHHIETVSISLSKIERINFFNCWWMWDGMTTNDIDNILQMIIPQSTKTI